VGVLMQEVLLTRIFSLTIWYHLAYLTISTALLGFAAAGSLLASRPQLLERGAERLASFASAGAGLALLASMWVLAPHPLEPDRLLSAPGSLFVGLLGYYALVALPFFMAGIAVATPLAAYPARANRLYAADLLGAGIGCGLAVAALTWTDGEASIVICAALFLAAAALYSPVRRHTLVFGVTAAALLAVAPAAHGVFEFLPSKSKALGQALRNPNTEVLFRRWSPVNRVDLYRTGDQRGGWWGWVGLSERYRGPRPRTLSIQYDGHNGSDVYEWRDRRSLRMLDHHILRTPYVLRDQREVLVIGVGGGIDVQNALRRGARHVTGVDLQPITIELHNQRLAAWTGGLFQRPEVELVASEGRHYVRSHRQRYDLVQITAVDTFAAQTTGAYVLAESYLYTVEAFQDYFARLTDDGMVSVIIGDLIYPDAKLPPPLLTRLALVAREALERAGVATAGQQILVLAQPEKRRKLMPDGQTVVASGSAIQNLIVKKTPFRDEELARVREFAARNLFQVRLSPDESTDPILESIVHAPRDQLERVLDEGAFALRPVTDDQPFFFNVLRWSSLVTGERIFWMFPGSSTGLLVLLMMLFQALVLGALLIFLPLVRTGTGGLPRRDTVRFLLYFLGLGLGFLLIEISFVQKYVLVLGYPTYSLSVTIFSLLVFAALGSYLSPRLWRRPRRSLILLLGCTALLVALEVSLMPWIRETSLAAPLALRIATTALLQLPLGVTLGMYFPTGLELLRRVEPRLVPWAWAVNGVASVVATVLAVILGIELGFSAVALMAVGVYAVGTLALVSALPDDASTA
jgi:hypothetical protein